MAWPLRSLGRSMPSSLARLKSRSGGGALVVDAPVGVRFAVELVANACADAGCQGRGAAAF